MWRGAVIACLAAVRVAHATPLDDAIAALACGDEAARDLALTTLERAPTGHLGLPDQSLDTPPQAMRARTIDRLLEVLAAVAERDPATEERVLRLVSSWNYCAITAEERVWDVSIEDATPVRFQDPYPSVTGGRGFAAWGLIPRRASGRPRARAAAVEGDVCEMSAPPALPSGSLAFVPRTTEPDVACERPPVRPTKVATMTVRWPVGQRLRRAAQLAPGHLRERVDPNLASGNTAIVPVGKRLAVTATVRQSLMGAADAGLVVTGTPLASTFVRVGASWALGRDFELGPSGRPRWSWGIGYDDWHPGTWSLQLNQWGPVYPSDGWRMVETAVAELGYKVPLGAFGNRFGAKVALSSPLQWRPPTASASLTLKLPAAIFASVGVSQNLAFEGIPTWTYVFGRSTWTARSLAILFTNYGPNPVPHPFFREHSSISLSWSEAW